ncbi:MAG: cation transporting ATPase C-terminal domain-containing protein [Verrucomicrobiales bacterium]
MAYLISCNISEIFVVGIATLFTSAIPLLPLQILFLNLVTDVFPALALGVTRSQRNILVVPPRIKGEAILHKKDWVLACWHALTIASTTLGAFFFAIFKLGQTPEEAITISFLTLALAQLFHVFNMASANEPFFASSIVKNKMVWGALLLCVGLLFLACWHPTMSEVLALRLPTGDEWQVIVGFTSLPVLIELIRRPILRAKKN